MYSSNPNDYHQYPSNPNDYHQYSSNQNDYQKFSPLAPPTAPPIFSQPTVTGYPATPQNPPAALQVQSQAQVNWSTGLCDCGQDVGNCCITCCCPCITFGQISDIVGKGSPSCIANGALYALISFVTGCGCLYSCFYRSKMRQQYSLNESPCGDCLVHCCCECCALCQEYRELKNRGFDMSIGWQGNVENQRRGAAMAPVIQEGMNR